MLDFSPAAYGYKRGCMVTVIAPLLEQRLGFCQTLNGGHDTDEGHWVWQSARALCEWLQSFHGIVTSEDTVARALEAIVKTGRWIREKLGRRFGQRAFYYRPTCAESIPQQCGTDSAKEREHTDSTSERTTIPDRCAFPEPRRTRPVKPVNGCGNPGAKPAEFADWQLEQIERQRAAQPEIQLTQETEPVQAPSTLDSRPQPDPVQPEPDLVTDNSSEGRALHELNSAKRRLWSWDGQMFRHPIRKSMTVEQAAADWTVDVVALKTVLLRQERALA